MVDTLKTPLILVVDDVETNIDILVDIIDNIYEVGVAINGESALESVAEFPPDLILLDIMMPEMDGYEVCRRIKSSEDTQDIPIIFITAKNQRGDETKGFELGAADYITKPFAPSVVLARVETHIKLKQARDMLKEQNKNLEKKVQERTKQLIHADRLASLGTFSAGMAHEINNPNSFISGNITFLEQFWTLAKPVVTKHANEDPTGRLSKFMGEIQPTIEGILDGSKRISKIVESLKSYSKGGLKSSKSNCSLLDPVEDAANLLRHKLKKGATLTLEIPKEWKVYCDRQQLTQVFVNLINNALEAMEEAGMETGKEILVKSELKNDHHWISIQDNGPGIPLNVAKKIFDPFFTKGKAKGTGLGLSIVQGIIEEHQGKISVVTEVEKGAMFLIVLPISKTL